MDIIGSGPGKAGGGEGARLIGPLLLLVMPIPVRRLRRCAMVRDHAAMHVGGPSIRRHRCPSPAQAQGDAAIFEDGHPTRGHKRL